MWASFEFLMSGLLFGREGGEMKKADTGVVGWRPDFFLSGDGGGNIPTSRLTQPRRLGATPPSQHSTVPHHPISHHIDEDALEGVYFAFSTILRCLPYFLRKTRPRASYELLEAFSSSLAADRASVGLPTSPISHFPYSSTPHSSTPSHPTSTRMP